jgi:radical SAM protein with 4Fe4S-binding SPASM domain
MTKIIEFLSDGVEQRPLVTKRLEILFNARIKDRGSMSSEDLKVLHALKKTVSQSQVAAIVEADSEQFEMTLQELHWLDKHDESNWVDYLVHRYKFRMFPKTMRVSDFPTYLLIEPTSVCNLRCVMCFQVDETFTLDKSFMGLMSWELFTSVVDQAADNGCQAITMASRGEPTLHKRFGEMLNYVSSKGLFDTKINTNATRLNEKLIHDILSSGVSNVTFSVDAITAESYEKIRVRGKFDEVLANVKLFNQIRAADYPNSPTTTRISGVAVNPDQDPVGMQQFWSKLVDEVTVVPNIHRFDSYNNPRFNRKEVCSILYSRMYVWWDGTCNPCDFDYKSLLKVGNANEQSIAEIWHGERYTRYRELHENMRRSELNPCDRCPL